jgi:hypothetical protein
MTEIPDDIKAVAWEVWLAALNEGTPDSASLIAAAILAERKRCARIASTEGVTPQTNVHGGGPEWYQHGQRIAAAIMRGDRQ